MHTYIIISKQATDSPTLLPKRKNGLIQYSQRAIDRNNDLEELSLKTEAICMNYTAQVRSYISIHRYLIVNAFSFISE